MPSPMMFGILGGYGEAQHQDSLVKMQQESERRKNMMSFWQQQAQNPGVRPEAQQVAMQNYMGYASTPLDKKVQGEDTHLNNFLQVKPQPGQTLTPEGAARVPPQSVQAPALAPELASPPQQIAPPVPPPGMTMSPFFSREEQLNLAHTAAQSAAEAEGMKAGAQEQAKLAATYGNPDVVSAMERLKIAEKGPFAAKPEDVVYLPNTTGGWNRAGGTGMRIKNPEENMQDAAVLNVLQKHNLSGKLTLDRNMPYMQQVPDALRMEIGQEYERLKKTPDPTLEAMRLESKERTAVAIQEMQTRMKELNLQLQTYSDTHGPEAMEAYRQQINQNPESIAEIPAPIKGQVISYMRQQGDRVPRPLGQAMQERESNADQTVDRIGRVAQMITEHPDLIGPVANALSQGQDLSGVALFRDPEKSRLAQDLATSLTFLQAVEAKTMLGSRPNFKWAEMFAKVTANQKLQMPLMRGALEAQLAHAQMVKQDIDRQRYGSQKLAAPGPPPGNTAQPQPGKSATMADVQAYATANRMSPKQALDFFQSSGYQVIGAGAPNAPNAPAKR